MKALQKLLTDHIEAKPDYLIELFKQLYKHTAIEYKDKLTSKEAALYLNISIKTLDNLCCDRKIAYYKYGKNREFALTDLKEYRKKKKYILVSCRYEAKLLSLNMKQFYLLLNNLNQLTRETRTSSHSNLNLH